MKNQDANRRIKQAFARITPDCKDTVLSCAIQQKGDCLPLPKKKHTVAKAVTAVAAAAALFALSVLGATYYQANYVIGTVVSLDVNPSIELKLAKNNKVLEVTARNDDGGLLVGDMNFKGQDIDSAVRALVDAMVENGYISSADNSVLISVDTENERSEAEIKQTVLHAIETYLSSRAIDCSILYLSVQTEDHNGLQYEQYGITAARAELIAKLVAAKPVYQFEDLIPLSVNELNLIMQTVQTVENVEVKGSASEQSYIGDERALSVALSHAKLSASSVSQMQIELDFDGGVMVYEVEFTYADTEYEYEINALTGEITDIETERSDDVDVRPDDRPDDDSEDDFDDGDARPDDDDSDHDDDSDERDDDRDDDSDEKDDGSDHDDRDGTEPDYGVYDPSQMITAERAKEIVFAHAGCRAQDVRDLEMEIEHDGGVTRYVFEFTVNGLEFEYEINAYTGSVISHESEKED